jgi:hypothetical protein
VGIWKQLCSPGADIRAVSYRCQMLGLLEIMLRAAWTGGELSANAFKVAARMDTHWMAAGVVQNVRTCPRSVWRGFLGKCLQKRSATLKQRREHPLCACALA